MKLIIITFVLAAMFGCSNSAKPVEQNTNTAPVATNSERPQTAIAHGPQDQTPAAPTGERSKWTQSGDPIDTREFDAAIATAEVELKKSPNNAGLKKKLADAYFNRGMELTNKGRQYASALGDFRRAVKNDPTNTEAQDWIKQIITIYESINRSYPQDGEEPPPLPFTKGK